MQFGTVRVPTGFPNFNVFEIPFARTFPRRAFPDAVELAKASFGVISFPRAPQKGEQWGD